MFSMTEKKHLYYIILSFHNRGATKLINESMLKAIKAINNASQWQVNNDSLLKAA